MQLNNEDNISWSSPPKKKRNTTNSTWRVPKFDLDLPKKKIKRKLKNRRRKYTFLCRETENINVEISQGSEKVSPVLNTETFETPKETHQSETESDCYSSPIINRRINLIIPDNSEVLSPVLNTKPNEKRFTQSFLKRSPVLVDKQDHSDSENESNLSPVINRRNTLQQIRKNKIKEMNCIRQLNELHNTEISKKDGKTETNINNKFKSFANKFTTYNENIEIEIVDSQEVCNAEKNNLKEKAKFFKSWKLKNMQEEINIEIVNSQEDAVLPRNLNETNYIKINSTIIHLPEIPEIELMNSQEILTPRSLHIESSQSSRKTSEDERCIIDSVESQKSSLITISSTGTVVQDSLEKSSEEYQLSPRKKKKYKPGSLAYRFHKLLRKQKADVAIWKHELYLTSTTTYQIPATKEDHLITKLKINRMFADFGTNIWECEQYDSNNEKCFVVINSYFLDNIVLEIGQIIKIIPPFFIKCIVINNINVRTFFNVHKIMKL